jgi:hypothetical protein
MLGASPTAPIRSHLVTETSSGAALTVIGVVLVVLGILVAGSFPLILTGIGALVAAELFATLRSRRA